LPITSAAVICHRGITCRSYKTWAKDGELHVCIMSLAKLARSLNQSMRLASTSLERVHAGPTRRDNHQRRRLDAGLGPHTSPERASRAAVEAADYVSPRRRPITTESIGSAAPHPSLRGALATKQPRGHRCAAPRLLRFANEKQRAQRSGKPALSYPRKRVSSGTRRGGARLAPGGSSKQPKLRQCRGILDARVRGHDTRETPHPGSGCLVQGDRLQAGTNSQ
jgi:hypothetical protein